MKILSIFFWGHPKIGLVLGVISMYFRVFFESKYAESGQNFKHFLRVLDIPVIFGG